MKETTKLIIAVTFIFSLNFFRDADKYNDAASAFTRAALKAQQDNLFT